MVTITGNVKTEAGGRGVDIKTFKGGRFAVMSIGSGCEETDIGRGWATLTELVKQQSLKTTGRWFEEHLEFDMGAEEEPPRLDLYVEIEAD